MAHSTESLQVFVESWRAATLDSGDIHDRISGLWARLRDAYGAQPAAPGDDPTDAKPISGVMRANTLNLLAVAPTPRDAELIVQTVSQLRDFLPSRTIILLLHDARSDDDGGDYYDVRVELLQQDLVGNDSGPQLHFETITINAPIQDVGHVPSLVEPLFVSELEDILWWPAGDHANTQLFVDLVNIVDRIIYDTAHVTKDSGALTNINRLFNAEEAKSIQVGDFSWQRLNPWRQLIAQFFDPPDTQACLECIDQVHIRFAAERADGSNGRSAAFLILGWLATRLGWQTMDTLDRRRDGSYWLPMVARKGDRVRQIDVRIEPDNSPHARFSLRSVELVAKGDSPGMFRVERTDSDDLVTSSETPDHPFVSRMVYSRRPEFGTMLAEELKRFGRDPLFDEAALFALDILNSPTPRR
jgi:glucose-6-phosphate dehydrogenase assembly protein OpcA